MTIARGAQICLDETPYYHCISRCVRRAFLCGVDRFSNFDYEHRRGLIEKRMVQLCKIFSIDICSYAIMSNHYHIVVHIDRDKASAMDDREVMARWGKLYSIIPIVQKYLDNKSESIADVAQAKKAIAEYRERLYSLSWFMKCLNEFVSRQFNKEDNCTGHFWEARFKCQALLDEEALLKCMAYVDLNPIRANIANTPEESKFTSIYKRIREQGSALLNFSAGQVNTTKTDTLPFARDTSLADYLQLVEWTGRVVRDDKKGYIPDNLPPILQRLEIDPDLWLAEIQHYGKWYYRAVGTVHQLKQFCQATGGKWILNKSPPKFQQ